MYPKRKLLKYKTTTSVCVYTFARHLTMSTTLSLYITPVLPGFRSLASVTVNFHTLDHSVCIQSVKDNTMYTLNLLS